jgi:integrative and conjugative element protein (TIGR02256 family)
MLLRNPFDEKTAEVLIEDYVIDVINPYKQLKARAREAGGILLGYRRGAHMHIVAATIPGPLDTRNRASFWRRDPSHQTKALVEWRRSNSTMDYLGEWHTHPEVQPSPSGVDCKRLPKSSSRGPTAGVSIVSA